MAERLWPDGPQLQQAPGVFPLGTDSVLLADFAAPGNHDRMLDLGTGSGILPLLLLWDRPGCSCIGLEISEKACGLARENLQSNGLSGRCSIIQGDLRAHRSLIAPGSCDLIVSNPPYFPAHAGKQAAGGLADARSDSSCSLEDLCTAAGWAIRWGGRFCLVFLPERLPELIAAMDRQNFALKRIRPVHHSPGRPVNLLLLEARKGRKPGLRWEPDLYLRDAAGNETPNVRRIYHRKE